jgi:hypothetical protein
MFTNAELKILGTAIVGTTVLVFGMLAAFCVQWVRQTRKYSR